MSSVRKTLQAAVARGRTKLPLEVKLLEQEAKLSIPGFLVQELQYKSDDSHQGWVPLTIIRPGTAPERLPAVVFLHATGKDRWSMVPLMMWYAQGGYFTAAIDCRYHGARCTTQDPVARRAEYEAALVRAYLDESEGAERPFLLDNVWDLQQLMDYLVSREDVDAARIGMMGNSLGGMHVWLMAALDQRVAVSAPIIGVQGFKWAIDNNSFDARVASIPQVFEAAAAAAKVDKVDREVVRKVWNKLTPGLLDVYDAPFTLPCIAPRPLLIVNAELDPRCPLPGVYEAVEVARKAYHAAGCPQNLHVFIEEGIGHQDTPAMEAQARQWMDRHLKGAVEWNGGVFRASPQLATRSRL